MKCEVYWPTKIGGHIYDTSCGVNASFIIKYTGPQNMTSSKFWYVCKGDHKELMNNTDFADKWIVIAVIAANGLTFI